MKKHIFVVSLIFAFLFGVFGAYMRALQFIYAFDFEEAILLGGSPYTIYFIIVCAAAVLLAVILSFIVKPEACESCKPACVSGYAASVVILVFAAMTLLKLKDEFSLIPLVIALISVYCAVAFPVMAKYSFEERDSSAYSMFSSIPAFWACFLLVFTYRDKMYNPVVSEYVILITSLAAMLLFSYALCGSLLGHKKPRVAYFACFAGMFFILCEILSPFFANLICPGYIEITAEKIRELLPLVSYLILMPFAVKKIM